MCVMKERALNPTSNMWAAAWLLQKFGLKCLQQVKQTKAYGGYLGIQRRWRAWKPTKSFGELETSFDPEIPEWGNP
jgi:hypothetical protein